MMSATEENKTDTIGMITAMIDQFLQHKGRELNCNHNLLSVRIETADNAIKAELYFQNAPHRPQVFTSIKEVMGHMKYLLFGKKVEKAIVEGFEQFGKTYNLKTSELRLDIYYVDGRLVSKAYHTGRALKVNIIDFFSKK